MTTPQRLMMLVAALLVVAACGGDGTIDPPVTTGSADVTTGAPDTATTAGPTTTAPGPPTQPEDPTRYLVDMSNLVAEYLDRAGSFGRRYTEENPQPVTEQEMIDFMAGYLDGLADAPLEHAAAVDGLVPPSGFEDAHHRYADSLRLLYEEWQHTISAFTTLAEYEEFWAIISDPTTGLPGTLGALEHDFIAACTDLEHTAAEAGHELDMQCPEPPAEAVEVSVEAGTTWIATPPRLPPGADLVAIHITNTGPEPIRPVVLDIFEGDPTNLPVAEGLVDIGLSGVIDPSSGHAAFGVAYPPGLLGDDSRVQGEPPELSPGESITVQLWIADKIVVFDYREGEYEAGSYLVIERQ